MNNKKTIAKGLYRFTIALKDYKKDELTDDDFATSVEFILQDIVDQKDKEKLDIIERFIEYIFSSGDVTFRDVDQCDIANWLEDMNDKWQEEQKKLTTNQDE